MSTRDEPVDFLISFAGGDEFFEVYLGERIAGEGQKLVARKDLYEVASQYDCLSSTVDASSELERLGRRLFGHLFDGVVGLFQRARDTAQRDERHLRTLIKLPHGSPLQRIPWEILHDGNDFLAKTPRSSVVRYFSAGKEVPSFEVAPPLRILLTSACPPTKDDLNLEAEASAVRKAYEGVEDLVRLKVERDVSLDRLEDLWRGAEVKRRPFHVWHHCGHGELEEGSGFELILEKRGQAEYVTVDQLSEIVSMCPGLKLAILNVCHGSSFVGLAPELARINVPVIVGFPSQVANDVAYKFAAVLHQCLLQLPVEIAVSQARMALCVPKGMDLEWCKPLLFSRRRDSGPILPAAIEPEVEEAYGFSEGELRLRRERIDQLLATLSNALGGEEHHEF